MTDRTGWAPWQDDQWVRRPSSPQRDAPARPSRGTGATALIHKTTPHHDVASGRRLGAGAPAFLAQDQVAPGFGEEEHVISQGRFGIDDRGKGLVVDRHEGGGVCPGALGLRHDRHHRLADKAHPPGREQGPQHGLGVGGIEGDQPAQVQVGRGHHIDHAGHAPGRGHVDVADQGVRYRGGHVSHVEDGGQVEVGDVLAGTNQ